MLNREDFYKAKNNFLVNIENVIYEYFEYYETYVSICFDGNKFYLSSNTSNSFDFWVCYITKEKVQIPDEFMSDYRYQEYFLNLIKEKNTDELKLLFPHKLYSKIKLDDYNEVLSVEKEELSIQDQINVLVDNFIDFWTIYNFVEKRFFVNHSKEYWCPLSTDLITDLEKFEYEDIYFIK